LSSLYLVAHHCSVLKIERRQKKQPIHTTQNTTKRSHTR
jgi:hypothetical protein